MLLYHSLTFLLMFEQKDFSMRLSKVRFKHGSTPRPNNGNMKTSTSIGHNVGSMSLVERKRDECTVQDNLLQTTQQQEEVL